MSARSERGAARERTGSRVGLFPASRAPGSDPKQTVGEWIRHSDAADRCRRTIGSTPSAAPASQAAGSRPQYAKKMKHSRNTTGAGREMYVTVEEAAAGSRDQPVGCERSTDGGGGARPQWWRRI